MCVECMKIHVQLFLHPMHTHDEPNEYSEFIQIKTIIEKKSKIKVQHIYSGTICLCNYILYCHYPNKTRIEISINEKTKMEKTHDQV